MKSNALIATGLAVLALSAALLLTAPVRAQGDDLVVVAEADFDRYWRADARRAQSLLLRQGPERYGCMAIPFVIETDGRVAPGRRPLLVRIGQAGAVPAEAVNGLHAHLMGSLPPFEPTWGAPPASPIYSARSMVIADARLSERLGEETWGRVHEELLRLCRIDDLAAWLREHPEQTVSQPLPADPRQLPGLNAAR